MNLFSSDGYILKFTFNESVPLFNLSGYIQKLKFKDVGSTIELNTWRKHNKCHFGGPSNVFNCVQSYDGPTPTKSCIQIILYMLLYFFFIFIVSYDGTFFFNSTSAGRYGSVGLSLGFTAKLFDDSFPSGAKVQRLSWAELVKEKKIPESEENTIGRCLTRWGASTSKEEKKWHLHLSKWRTALWTVVVVKVDGSRGQRECRCDQ